MCFHGNQLSWVLKHPFISLYSKYHSSGFICSPTMLAPVVSSLDGIYCTCKFVGHWRSVRLLLVTSWLQRVWQNWHTQMLAKISSHASGMTVMTLMVFASYCRNSHKLSNRKILIRGRTVVLARGQEHFHTLQKENKQSTRLRHWILFQARTSLFTNNFKDPFSSNSISFEQILFRKVVFSNLPR